MSSGTLLLCPDVRAAHWELGPLPAAAGPVWLLGWSGQPRDGGLPPAVRRAIAAALCGVFRVAFPTSQPFPEVGDDWAAPAGRDDGLVALAARSGNRPARARRTVVLCTRTPALADTAFDDAGFPWWLRGQCLLLSRPDDAPPRVDEALLHRLIGPAWAADAALLRRHGVSGVLAPGVDGDVAGLLVPDAATREHALAALRAQARAEGLDVAVVAEADVG